MSKYLIGFILIVLPHYLSANSELSLGEFDQRSLLEIALILIIAILFFAERDHLIKKHKKEIEKLSSVDNLTALYNRSKIDEVLEYHMHNVKRYKNSFSIVLLDIDNINKINSKYGQSTGDDVLIDVAKILSNSVRSSDVVGRWGSDEFMVICPHTHEKNALALAEKIRRRIHMYKFDHVGKVTASFGISEYNSEKHSLDELVKNVNKALHYAKVSGRDQSSVH